MATCCRGRKAGTPITKARFYSGLLMFCTYHLMMLGLLSFKCLTGKKFRPVRRFQWTIFKDHVTQIWKADEIVFGRAGAVQCRFESPGGGVAAVGEPHE